MHHLLQALSRHVQFLVRGLLRLLYKRMQNDYSLAHQKTIKRVNGSSEFQTPSVMSAKTLATDK
jgi:hypothetical protein